MIDQSLLFFTDIDDFVLFILRKEIELDWKFATGVVYNTFLKIQQYPEACNYSIVRILSRLLIYKGIDEELMVIPCMNNKVLFLNMSNIEDITLSDFDADTPSGKNWDEHVSCGEIPLVVYEALEDYEENSQVTLYNDTENSTELYKYLMEYVRKNGWTEEDIFQLLNTSVFYYLDGRKKSTIIDFYQDSDDIIETIEMVYGYDFTDIEQNFMFYIDAHDETENFVNLKGISMMELPLLKVEEEIFRRNDQ